MDNKYWVEVCEVDRDYLEDNNVLSESQMYSKLGEAYREWNRIIDFVTEKRTYDGIPMENIGVYINVINEELDVINPNGTIDCWYGEDWVGGR